MVTDLVTGEAVVLDVRAARLPTRILALLLDVLVQLALLGLVALVAGRIGSLVDSALTQAIMLVLFLLVIIGYPAMVETLWRGKSLGKAAAGLRIVSDDGGPERFRQALFRALTGFVEIWITFGSVALITSLCSQQGRRLGDIFAGTLAVRERMPVRGGAVAAMPPQLASWAAGLELSGLTNDVALHARQFISRYDELAPQVRDEMSRRIASAVTERVSPPPPPGTPPATYISAVLAERRRREETRLGTQQPYDASPPAYGYGPPPAPHPQAPYGGPEGVYGAPPAHPDDSPQRTSPQQPGRRDGPSPENPPSGGFAPPS